MNALLKRQNLVWLIALSLAGCTARPAPTAPANGWVRTELYFGMTRPGGAAVTADEWDAFLDTAVTPRFPDGLTIVQAKGRFRSDQQGPIEEPTGLLIILHPTAGSEANDRINQICQAYIRLFQQESVLRIDSPASATFLTSDHGRSPDAPHPTLPRATAALPTSR